MQIIYFSNWASIIGLFFSRSYIIGLVLHLGSNLYWVKRLSWHSLGPTKISGPFQWKTHGILWQHHWSRPILLRVRLQVNCEFLTFCSTPPNLIYKNRTIWITSTRRGSKFWSTNTHIDFVKLTKSTKNNISRKLNLLLDEFSQFS